MALKWTLSFSSLLRFSHRGEKRKEKKHFQSTLKKRALVEQGDCLTNHYNAYLEKSGFLFFLIDPPPFAFYFLNVFRKATVGSLWMLVNRSFRSYSCFSYSKSRQKLWDCHGLYIVDEIHGNVRVTDGHYQQSLQRWDQDRCKGLAWWPGGFHPAFKASFISWAFSEFIFRQANSNSNLRCSSTGKTKRSLTFTDF